MTAPVSVTTPVSITVSSGVALSAKSISTAPEDHVGVFNLAGDGGTNNAALNIVSANTAFSACEVTGHESGHGTLKISHVNAGSGPTSDQNVHGRDAFRPAPRWVRAVAVAPCVAPRHGRRAHTVQCRWGAGRGGFHRDIHAADVRAADGLTRRHPDEMPAGAGPGRGRDPRKVAGDERRAVEVLDLDIAKTARPELQRGRVEIAAEWLADRLNPSRHLVVEAADVRLFDHVRRIGVVKHDLRAAGKPRQLAKG